MGRVCPWWMAYTFDHPLRRLAHPPERMLAAYVRPGMTALDIGCGMGFFSIAMAGMVAPDGLVVAVDLQQRMLDVLMKRARRKHVDNRIRPYRCGENNIGNHGPADFALACYSLHEAPDRLQMLQQIRACLKPSARFYLMEPPGEVGPDAWKATLAHAEMAGFALLEQPRVRFAHAAVLGLVR